MRNVVTSAKYVAFIKRVAEAAVIEIREKGVTSLGKVVAYYETASRGAKASAEREMRKLEEAA